MQHVHVCVHMREVGLRARNRIARDADKGTRPPCNEKFLLRAPTAGPGCAATHTHPPPALASRTRSQHMSLVLAMAWSLAAAPPSDPTTPRCRCLPGDPCWERIDWAALNASVGGRLEKSTDVMAPCLSDLQGEACSHALEGSDDEFWLSSLPNGFQHTGIFGMWNLSDHLSTYAVRAETEADFQETVSFAAANNLRLVIKATGHDWYVFEIAAYIVSRRGLLMTAAAFSTGTAARPPAAACSSGRTCASASSGTPPSCPPARPRAASPRSPWKAECSSPTSTRRHRRNLSRATP